MSRQQQLQILSRQVSNYTVVCGDDRVGQVTLALLQLQHLLLDRATRNQAVSKYLPRLSDAVRAVDRLCFDGRIPPGVEKIDVLGRMQIKAETTGFETDEKQLQLW